MKGTNYLKVALNWIILSSSNPTEVSDTLKGTALALFAAWMPVLALVHIPVDSALITTCIVSGFAILQAFLVLVGAIVAFIGIFNKIMRTIKGTNAVFPQATSAPVVTSVSTTTVS